MFGVGNQVSLSKTGFEEPPRTQANAANPFAGAVTSTTRELTANFQYDFADISPHSQAIPADQTFESLEAAFADNLVAIAEGVAAQSYFPDSVGLSSTNDLFSVVGSMATRDA